MIRFLSLCILSIFATTVFGQHLVYLNNDAITGNGAPAYGYSQYFSKTNNYLYVCNGNQIVIFTATIANDPVFNRNFTGGIYWQMLIDGTFSYVSANTNGVRDYDMNTANFPRPSFIGSVPTANDASNIVKIGDYVYVARGFYGLGTVNVTIPASPALVNTYSDGSGNWNSVTATNNVIAASRDGGFRTFTRTNPAQPQAAALVTLSSTPTQLHLEGNRLFLQVASGADSGISIYDVANPASPSLLARIARTSTTYLVDGNYLYAASSLGGNLSRVYTYSIANLPTIAVVDSFSQNLGQVLSMYRDNAVMHAIRYDGSQRDMMTFDILGDVTVLSPNGLETLYTGDNVSIQWQGNRTPGVARIELNRNYPSGEWEYITDVAFADGQYTWQLAGPVTTNARFRVRSLQYNILYDESDFSFSIIDRSISYVSPAAGTTLYVGDSDTVRWSHVGLTGDVTVAFNQNYPSGTWTDLGAVPADNGQFVWTINSTATTTARYRVTSAVYPVLTEVTPGNLAVQNRVITVSTPNGGEILYAQDTLQIQWTSQNVSGNVVVEINRSYPSGSYTTLATVPVAQGQISWPITTPTSTAARIRVRSVDYPIATDVSNANFQITVRSISVTKPVGGELWNVLSNDTIKWNYINMTGNVRIDLNRNYPSGTWETLNTVPLTNLSYIWNITAPVSSTARIRLVSVSYPWISAVSANNFTIRANPSVYFTPASLTYTNVPVHTTSTAQTVRVASRSQLQLHAVTFTHSNTRFTITLLDADSTVTGTDSLRFQVTYSPDSVVTVRDTLRVTFSSPYQAIAIPLSGTGAGGYFRGSPTVVSFDTTEAGATVTSLVTLQNTGNVALTPIRIGGGSPDFSATLPDTTIPAGGAIFATMRFHPQGAGLRNGTLYFIAPNSIDNDTIVVTASGIGKTTPRAPENVTVNTAGENASVVWSPVTQSLNGYPIAINRYLVFFNASNPYNPNTFFFLSYTLSDTLIAHNGVVRFSLAMNYQVRAWIGDNDSFDSVIRTIPEGTPIEEVYSRLRPFAQ